ncbi:MAG: hypothetical protein RLZZ251_153 [Actinomycetota bacterium]|jgi:hypothetical protein
MANDLFSALRTYLSQVSGVEKTPQEIAAALNLWARESSEAIKERIEEEIQRSAKKMGFAKQSDLDALAREVEKLSAQIRNRPASAGKSSGRPQPAKPKTQGAKKAKSQVKRKEAVKK